MAYLYAGAMVTPAPMFRRDEQACPENFNLCPENLGGGCCPQDRSCGPVSCHATTAAPMSVCDKYGWNPCGIEEGGGCCPQNHECFGSGCRPLSGAVVQTCSPGFELCPEEFGIQCCKEGLACGAGFCYSTNYPTVTLTQTMISRDPDAGLFTTTATITTTFSPASIPPADPLKTSDVVGRATETAIPKIASVRTESKGGLSGGALKGLIAGAVVILVVIVVAAYFILRRLKKVSKQSENHSMPVMNKHDLSGGSGGSNGGKNDMVAQSTVSVDPFMMRSEQSTPRLHRPSMTHAPSSDADAYAYSYSGNSTPPIPAPYVHGQMYPSGYVSLPVNETGYFDQPTSQLRHMSYDANGVPIYSPPYNSNRISEVSSATYSTITDQNLRFGHDSYASSQGHANRPSIATSHGRQRSDTSDYSQGSVDSNQPLTELEGRRISLPESELDSTTTAWGRGRGASGLASSSSLREGPANTRKGISGWNFMHNRKRSIPVSTPMSGGGRLEGVAEAEGDSILGQPTDSSGKGKAKGKEWVRPKILTKDTSDRSGSPAKTGRSRSDSVVPQVAMYSYVNQEESNRLPGGSPSTPIGRRGSAHNFPAIPVNMPSHTQSLPENSILVTTSVETTVDTIDAANQRREDSPRRSDDAKKDGVQVSTYEVTDDDRDRTR